MAENFQRNLSPEIQAILDEAQALNKRAYNTHIACVITLQDESVLNYATADIVMDSLSIDGASSAITPIPFISRLSGVPDIHFGSGQAPDAGEFKVSNLDYIISSAIPDTERVFDNCKITVYVAFRKSDGNYEGIPYFYGMLREINGNDEDGALQIVHELSNRASTVGKEITQRCINTLGDAWCGVNLLPVDAVCSKVWADDVAGCQYWGGVFNGVPFLGNSAFGGYTGSAGGWEDEFPIPQRDCPCAETTWFESADGGFIHASELRIGHHILAPQNEVVEVEDCEIVDVTHRILVETYNDARFIGSASHHMLTSEDDMHGRPLSAWNFQFNDVITRIHKSVMTARATRNPSVKRPNYSFKPLPSGKVLRLRVSGSHRYWAGMDRHRMIAHHNLKDWFPIILV